MWPAPYSTCFLGTVGFWYSLAQNLLRLPIVFSLKIYGEPLILKKVCYHCLITITKFLNITGANLCQRRCVSFANEPQHVMTLQHFHSGCQWCHQTLGSGGRGVGIAKWDQFWEGGTQNVGNICRKYLSNNSHIVEALHYKSFLSCFGLFEHVSDLWFSVLDYKTVLHCSAHSPRNRQLFALNIKISFIPQFSPQSALCAGIKKMDAIQTMDCLTF